MTHSMESILQKTAGRIGVLTDIHRAYPEISFASHVCARRIERACHAKKFILIYLDTNAWKCVADFRQKKASLTPSMNVFAETIEEAAKTGRFAFPIGLPTFFELDSMTDSTTRRSMAQLVDEFSRGLCTAPFPERAGFEINQLLKSGLDSPVMLQDFVCSPAELLGIPRASISHPDISENEAAAFSKAFFDAVSELPFSFQLQVAGASLERKWNNSLSTANLNIGKANNQAEIANLKIGIFVELKGLIDSWRLEGNIALSERDILSLAGAAICHWHENPSSRALPTFRILSSLYGLMRFDPQRRYRDGDSIDFMVAASALPIAKALFTDRKLASLLADPRIRINRFSDCTIVSGFEEMGSYLRNQLKMAN